MKTRRSRLGDRRGGMTVLVALVVLVLASLLLIAAVRNAVIEYRQVRQLERERQATWLAASGLARAKARLATDPGYTGESWSIDASEFAQRQSAVVTIEVGPVEARPSARRLTARADFPPDGPRRVRESQQLIVELP